MTDRRSSIAVVPVPCDEAFVVQTVVECAIGHVATGIRCQQMDDVVFADGEADIESFQ